MKLIQIRYFLAVCKYGTFANASKALFVSQPAVSQSIRELEKEYNILLFSRNNNRLVLTEDGKWFQYKCENLLRIADDLENDLKERFEQRRVVKIGVAPMAGNIFFYPIINDMRKHLEDIVPDVREAGSLEINRWIEVGAIDLGYGLINCIDNLKTNYYKLNDAELKFCVHKSHPLASYKELEFKDLENYKICMLGNDSYQNTLLTNKFKDEGIKPNVLMYSSQISSIITMLSYGNCGAFMFDGIVNDEQFVSISMKEPIILSLGIIWNNLSQDFIHVNTVRKYLINAFEKKNK